MSPYTEDSIFEIKGRWESAMNCGKVKLNWLIHPLVWVFTVFFLWTIWQQALALNTTTMERTPLLVVGVIVTAFIVNIIKALRMYIITFDYKISIWKYIRFYIVTAFVNITIPFKCGELYRGYYLGTLINSLSEGYIMVIFDRFIDTLALITIVIGVNVLLGTDLGVIYLLLAGFLFIVLAVYLLFPPLYMYWNHYLVYHRSSSNTLKALHFLEACNKTYGKISHIVSGRFVILYIISLLVWIVEIASVLVITSDAGRLYVSEYLQTILTGETTQYNFLFLFGSVLLYTVLGVVCLFKKGDETK